jgi:hypothetical protein
MYLLSSTSNIQTISSSNEFSTLLKHSVSALEVDTNVVIPISLAASVVTTITVPLTQIQLIAVKSSTPVDLSLKLAAGADVFCGFPTTYHLLVRPDGLVFNHIKLLSSVATFVEVVVAGKFV